MTRRAIVAFALLCVASPLARAGFKEDLLAGREAIRQGHYDQAEAPLQSALKEADPGSLDAAAALNELTKLYCLTGHYDSSDGLGHQAIALEAGHDALIARSLENLGELDTNRGKYLQAKQELQKAMDIRIKLLGEESADTAETMTNLGVADLCLCDYDLGTRLCERAVEIQSKILGDDDPARAFGWDNLATARYLQGRLVEAESLFTRALNLRSRVLGEDHPDVGTSYDNLGWLYLAWGDRTSARRYFKLAQFTRENALGDSHPDTMESLAMLAEVEDTQRVSPEITAPMMEKAIALEMKILGPSHWLTQTLQANLAGVYQESNRSDDAEKLLLAAESAAEKSFGVDNPNTANVEISLADYYAGAGNKPAEADKLYKRSLATLEKYFGADDRDVGFELDRYGQFLKGQGRDAEAEPLLKRAKEIEEQDEQRNPLNKLEGPEL